MKYRSKFLIPRDQTNQQQHQEQNFYNPYLSNPFCEAINI